jgi:DNA-binding NtrC family response regulator
MPLGPIRVLILDDEVELRRVLADFLDDEGRFEVRDVATAAEALSALEAEGADVCLVDLRLEGTDGFAFVQEATARFPRVKFLVYTGSYEMDVRERARSAGIPDDRILLKPLPLEEIVKALDRAVGA